MAVAPEDGRARVAEVLRAAVGRGMAPWPAGELDTLAGQLVLWQTARLPAWEALCRSRGWRGGGPWTAIPAVPTDAFKRLDLFVEPEVDRVHTFRTSGTSGSVPGSAGYSGAGLDLMAEAVRVNAEAMLFPDGRPTRIAVLAPSPELAPHMIMAWGMARLVELWGVAGSGFLVGSAGLDRALLDAVLNAADVVPVTLIGATFGLVHLLDGLADGAHRLPEGSRVLHAGGFKGRSREVGPEELVDLTERRLGVPGWRCVNLLGMTELSSQFYEAVLRDGPGGRRIKVNPPWTGTVAVDPDTLRPVPHGELGLLRHLDLANLDHPCVVQTDDLGVVHADGFEVFGRATPDGSRGCSLALEALVGG